MPTDELTAAEQAAVTRARRRARARTPASPGTRDRPRVGRPPRRDRSANLDTARGVALALVIAGLASGAPDHLPEPLAPVAWHGFAVGDLLAGVLTVLAGVAVAHQRQRHPDAGPAWWTLRWLRRTTILVAVSYGLAWLAAPDPAAVRLTGPLVRLAAGSALAALVAAILPRGGQVLAVGAGLAGHWLLLRHGPVPPAAGGRWSSTGNVAAHLDPHLLGDTHVLLPTDPDGLLTVLPTAAAVVAGIWIGGWLLRRPPGPATAAAAALSGLYVGGAAVGWAQFHPVNATLWTGPYVLLSVAATLLLLAATHLAVDLSAGLPRPLRPVAALGGNALPAYVATIALLTVADDRWRLVGERVAAPLLGRGAAAIVLGGIVAAGMARATRVLTDRGLHLRA